MKKVGRQFVQLPRSITLGLLFVAGVMSIVGSSQPNIVPPSARPFSIAYVDTTFRLRIRWSQDGITWSTPFGATPDINHAPGIGISDNGTQYLAVFDDGFGRATMMMGLGPDNWDSTPRSVGNAPTGEFGSGTSIAHVSGQNWLVAYNRQNRAKIVKFDSSATAQVLGTEVTPRFFNIIFFHCFQQGGGNDFLFKEHRDEVVDKVGDYRQIN